MSKLVVAFAAVAATLAVAAPATAVTTVRYQATYVEPVGGPNQSPFSCAPGTTCGSANISGIGRTDNYFATFNVCGFAATSGRSPSATAARS